MRAMAATSGLARRGDQPALGGANEEGVGIERGLDRLAGQEVMEAGQDGAPVAPVAVEMYEAFRAGDFRQRHRRGEDMMAGPAVGPSVGNGELVGAETDTIGSVTQR